MGALRGCQPRAEVLKGDLDDAIFAADFGDLIAGKAPAVYADAKTFFGNTHPAKPLRKIVEDVFGRLTTKGEGGATIRLSTGFGGGKTHTLMAFWHLAQNIGDPAIGTSLLPAAGRPKQLEVVAVDAGKGGVPEFASHGRQRVRSLWGEVFHQFGGEQALKRLGKADDPEGSPSEDQIRAVLPAGPVLILLDELVIYMAKLSERGQGNLLGFLNCLAAVVSKRPQTVLVVTDPADQRVFAREAARIGDSLTAAAVKLDDVFGRKMTDFDPIGDESARVIVCRLFERVDPAAAEAASAAYHHLYDRVVQEYPGALPPIAAGPDYARRIVECYPFHPRLLDTAQGRLGALQEFNKSRGTLRFFARLLRTVWEAEADLELVGAGDVDWSSERIQADLLQRLNRDSFKAAVTADLGGHAVELDGDEGRGLHARVASALLLESIPMQSNSGLDPAELTLAVLRPDEAGPEPAEALDRLVGACWHTYPMPGGRGWQFRYEPNIIKQIEERMGQVPLEDARSRVLTEAQGYFSGPTFKLSPWPGTARHVPESADLQLVLCEDEKTARSVCAYADDSDPQAPIPRRFQNAIVAVAPTGAAFNGALDRAQRLIAAEAIEREHRTGDTNKLVRDQLQRIKPELVKQFRIQTCRAFDRVVLAGGMSHPLEEQFQVPEEVMLQRAQGQSCLRRFLDEKGLLYQPGDALDVGRFLKDILPGTTPVPDKPDVYTARAIHERFLGAPGLRLLPDGGIVRQTVLKALSQGKVVVRLADGRAYDTRGCVEGTEGRRRRIPGSLTTLPLDESAWVTPATLSWGSLWTKEDQPEAIRNGGGLPPPPPQAQATRAGASTWPQVLDLAAERPLLELRLLARTPADAASLVGLAQPLGAESLALSVTVSGELRDSGTVSFSASDLKPSHPTRPLQIAQTLFNSLSDGATYETELALHFGAAGRTGLEALLRALVEGAPETVAPRAQFDKPTGAAP